MNRGFYTILAAQFFSALADNALLFAAIALLKTSRRPGLAHTGPAAVLRLRLHRAGAVRRPLRRRAAQGPRDVREQCGQDRRLRGDAARTAPALRLRHRRHRRRDVLAGEVRHPHRVPAARETGTGQRLDGRPHRRRHHPRRHHRRHHGRGPDRQLDRRSDLRAEIHAGIDTAPGGRDRRHPRCSTCRRDHQSLHPAGGHRPQAAEAQSLVPAARLLAQLQAAVARSARTGVARGHDAVLGRGRHAAADRPHVGGTRAQVRPRDRRPSSPRSSPSASPSAPSSPRRRVPLASRRAGAAGGHRDGRDRDRDGVHHGLAHRHRAADPDRRHGRAISSCR